MFFKLMFVLTPRPVLYPLNFDSKNVKANFNGKTAAYSPYRAVLRGGNLVYYALNLLLCSMTKLDQLIPIFQEIIHLMASSGDISAVCVPIAVPRPLHNTFWNKVTGIQSKGRMLGKVGTLQCPRTGVFNLLHF